MTSNRLVLYGSITVCCAIEAVLGLGDRDIMGPTHLRQLVYDYGAFWPGLLANWKPNYDMQPYTMFITYGFLHSGLLHLSVNMITLWSLGCAVLNRVDQGRFLIIYFSTMIAGGAFFALLMPGLRPMVGASGALFGLLGALLAWEHLDRKAHDEGLWHIALVVLLLAGLNLVLWWAMDGQLAWQAHLGGFFAGWVSGILLDRKPLGDCRE